QAESATTIEPDAVVLVRGRIDHKDRGETKLVVQEAERFEPDGEEIASASAAARLPSEPVKLTIDVVHHSDPDVLIEELKALFEHHKGDAPVHLAIANGDGTHELKLGDAFRVRPSSLRAELGHVPGVQALAA
ncbi:MAG TPA: hypothetical protein VGB06_00095, partial [Solirubrobacterales bacterium]